MCGEMLPAGPAPSLRSALAVEREEHGAAAVPPAQRGVGVVAVLLDALRELAVGAELLLAEREGGEGVAALAPFQKGQTLLWLETATPQRVKKGLCQRCPLARVLLRANRSLGTKSLEGGGGCDPPAPSLPALSPVWSLPGGSLRPTDP